MDFVPANKTGGVFPSFVEQQRPHRISPAPYQSIARYSRIFFLGWFSVYYI